MFTLLNMRMADPRSNVGKFDMTLLMFKATLFNAVIRVYTLLF